MTLCCFHGVGEIASKAFGATGLYLDWGNVVDAMLSIDEDVKTVPNRANSAGGNLCASRRISAVKFTAKLSCFYPENISKAMYGSSATASQSSATDTITVTTANTIYAPSTGKDLRLANITAAVVGTTNVLPFLIQKPFGIGLIDEVASANITFPADVAITYTVPELIKIKGLNKQPSLQEVLIHGVNIANDDKKYLLTLYKVRFSPMKELPIIADDFAYIDLEGEVLADLTRPVDDQYYSLEVAA